MRRSAQIIIMVLAGDLATAKPLLPGAGWRGEANDWIGGKSCGNMPMNMCEMLKSTRQILKEPAQTAWICEFKAFTK
jgi:hypothetical protein